MRTEQEIRVELAEVEASCVESDWACPGDEAYYRALLWVLGEREHFKIQ